MKHLLVLLFFISSFCLGNEIHIFGDSVFDTQDRGIHRELQSLTGTQITDHSKSGTWMNEIRDSYLRYRDDDDLKIVVIDGGGNDMLGSNCRGFSEECKMAIDNAIIIIANLFKTMEEDGVEQIIYLGGYYFSGWQAGYNSVVDYSFEQLTPVCDEVSCTLIDPREDFKDTSHISWDGIHPSGKGVRRLAELIYEALEIIETERQCERIKENMNKIKLQDVSKTRNTPEGKRSVFNSNL